MEIEQVAETQPDRRSCESPWTRPPASSPFHARKLAFGLGLEGRQVASFTKFVLAMYQAPSPISTAPSSRVNPLVVTGAGDIVALDAKVSFDDNALYRQPDLEKLRDEAEEDPKELEGCQIQPELHRARRHDRLHGERRRAWRWRRWTSSSYTAAAPANFLDVGGGATKERVTAAFKIILSDPHVEGILVNIFGGIMRCDVIAEGVIAAAREVSLGVPLVVRLEGTNVDLGKELLAKSGLPIVSADNLADAAEKVVRAVKEAA